MKKVLNWLTTTTTKRWDVFCVQFCLSIENRFVQLDIPRSRYDIIVTSLVYTQLWQWLHWRASCKLRLIFLFKTGHLMNATDFIVTIRIVVNNAEWRHLKLVADNIIISVAHFMLKSSNENVEGRHQLWVSNDSVDHLERSQSKHWICISKLVLIWFTLVL